MFFVFFSININISAATDSYLRTGAGNDTVAGTAGRDRLEGGDGNDSLNGGAGFDIMEINLATANLEVGLQFCVSSEVKKN